MVEPSSDAHEWLGVTIFRKTCQVPGHARVYVQELPSAWTPPLRIGSPPLTPRRRHFLVDISLPFLMVALTRWKGMTRLPLSMERVVASAVVA